MLAGSLSAWGPLAAGAIYDATGTYRPAWMLSAGFNVLAFFLLLACRPPGLARAPSLVAAARNGDATATS